MGYALLASWMWEIFPIQHLTCIILKVLLIGRIGPIISVGVTVNVSRPWTCHHCCRDRNTNRRMQQQPKRGQWQEQADQQLKEGVCRMPVLQPMARYDASLAVDCFGYRG